MKEYTATMKESEWLIILKDMIKGGHGILTVKLYRSLWGASLQDSYNWYKEVKREIQSES